MGRVARLASVAALALFSLGPGIARCDTPQVDETATAPCCPHPRFVGPLSRDGQGRVAAFDVPTGIAYDPRDDAFYIADPGSNTIRRVDSQWRVTTVAGACERELVMATCVGGELDGPGALARFDRPSLIAYDARDRGLLIYDVGSSALRVLANGVVQTLGRASDLTSLAVDNARAQWYAAQRKSVVELSYDGAGTIRAGEIWNADRFRDRPDAPAYDVNAVAVDPASGDVFAGAYGSTIVRLVRARDFREAAVADAKTFKGIRAMTYDALQRKLLIAEYNVIRSVTPDGRVTTSAGGCDWQADPRYRGEFTCDYPARDGSGRSAHFGGSIAGIALDVKRGNVAILDGRILRILRPSGDVATVAGNQGPSMAAALSRWTGRYTDTASGETMDVAVDGDDEVEVLRNAKGDVFDVRRGKRSVATSNAEFWMPDTFVRVGAPATPVSFTAAFTELACGSFGQPVTRNPFPSYMGTKAEKLFVSWFTDQYASKNGAQFLSSRRCAAFRALQSGAPVYEEYESRSVAHTVPHGLTVYPDERLPRPAFVP